MKKIETRIVRGFNVEDVVWKADVYRASNLDLLLMQLKVAENMGQLDKINVKFENGDVIEVAVNRPTPGSLIYEVDMELYRGEPVYDGVVMQGSDD